MAKPKKDPPAAPSQPTPAPQFPDSLTLKLEPDARIQVTVAQAEQPAKPLNRWLKWLIYAVIILGGCWLGVYGKYIQPRAYSPGIELSGTALSAKLSHPSFVAFGDEAELDVTITNTGDDTFNGFVTLIFNGNVAPLPLPPETTRLEIKDLSGKASATHRVKFALGESPQWFSGESIRIGLQASSANQRFNSRGESIIRIAPFPYLRTFSSALSGSAVIIAVAALLWEVVRKRFFGWEAK